MEELLSATVRGIGLGSLYTLLGLGFVIVYKGTRVVNFAQPALMILGAYLTSTLAIGRGVPFGFAVVLAMLIAALIAATIERIAMRPMVGQAPFSAAMVTIGIFFVLQVFAGDLIGLEQRQGGDPWGLDRWNLSGVEILHADVARILIAATAVVGLALFFTRTRWGIALRATAFSQETALAQGVPVGRMFGLAWALAGALGGIAGALIAAGSSFDGSTTLIALKALPAIILGGLDSTRGAIVGGVIIGVAETYAKTYQSEYLAWAGANFDQVVPYVVMLLVLLIRPYGLFGTPEVRRV